MLVKRLDERANGKYLNIRELNRVHRHHREHIDGTEIVIK